ncbi:hypothetical protein BGZ65_010688 [Modicella reniformis]|uniref:Uncharacterized protein n=1 Tax=Modicella reniformis TaxID=1440133 RepID=A0A9P6IRU9_9FUNG|nr:hypothetical protein BGZ65_010688 [Modicella reniformis]
MIQATGNQSSSSETELSDNDNNNSLPSLTMDHPNPKAKRPRNFLEDSEDEDRDGDDGGGSQTFSNNDLLLRASSNKKSNRIDGMSLMFDHLILPLISLTNAYRKQAKGLEAIIKTKENEVVEALEILEQCGVGYQNRRKATERYDKTNAEIRLREDVEQLIRPQLFGPKELFSDKVVPALCSIVSKNAAIQDTPLSSFESSTGLSQSQDIPSNQVAPLGPGAVRKPGAHNTDAATLTLQRDPATATMPIAGTDAEADARTTTKSSKEADELERRRVLQEQLDKEKAEKEKGRKKKKLF